MAAALTALPPLARAALAAERGLLDSGETRSALQGQSPASLGKIPALPDVPPRLREMWLRQLSALVLLSEGGADPSGAWSEALAPTLEGRIADAQRYARKVQRPLTYAVGSSVLAQQLAQRYPAVEFVTVQEAALTFAARSPSRLRQWGRWRARVVVLDDLHRLDPRGVQPLKHLLEDAVTFGQTLRLTGAFPSALHEAVGELDLAGGKLQFKREGTSLADVVAEVQRFPEKRTLALMPTRRAALALLAELPAATLLSRSKTAHHLAVEAEKLPALGAGTVIGTPGSAPYLAGIERVVTGRLTWPLLGEVCLKAGEVVVVPVLDFPEPNAQKTAVSLSLERLAAGEYPLTAGSQSRYWAELGPLHAPDPLGIGAARQQLNYRLTGQLFRQLFEAGQRVLVDVPEARRDVERARRTGFIPTYSPFTVRMTPDSLTRAREAGELEEVGEALIWKGEYSQARGVGRP
ncbi:hypothetical protein [Deinococcus xinjiangensis]|uniref:hypothetical protein n=1 Tax=Deinococcus xinjiangensis TaxID=457454 RepID=UPI003365990E